MEVHTGATMEKTLLQDLQAGSRNVRWCRRELADGDHRWSLMCCTGSARARCRGCVRTVTYVRGGGDERAAVIYLIKRWMRQFIFGFHQLG